MSKFAALLSGGAALVAVSLSSAQALPIDGTVQVPVQAVSVAYGCPPGMVRGAYRCEVFHPWLHRVYHPYLHRTYHPWMHRY